ncbi:MAG TPA: helix-turn-helix domain-containing protein [Planctomycetota bacterium]|nr:helix-turn-helix domain-containing protein [Planctomycetota bacterium]
MPHSLHEKIEHALAQRGLLKRDLARALNVSPQTATDICKGRSAVTLPHLRRLVSFFALRSDYWLDDERLEPSPSDEVSPERERRWRELLSGDIAKVADPAAFAKRLIEFAREHRDACAARFPDLPDDERAILNLPRRGAGHVGQVAAPLEVSS